ncbi:MAG: glycosyltransferase family 87 protein [Nocardioides sp.]
MSGAPSEASPDGSPVPPTYDDPLSARLSEGLGGPLGSRAGGHRWWTPVRVVLLLTAVCFALGMVQKAPCYHTRWGNEEIRYSAMCYSDLPYLYTGRGFAELNWPYTGDPQVRARYDVMEYPVGIAYYAWGTAWVTHWLSGSPDLTPRYGLPVGNLAELPDVIDEEMLYVAVNAIGFLACALAAAWFLVRVHRRRPWDALFFAASPLLLVDALVNWDLLAVVCVAGALWAWSRDRPVATGVLLGLGTAAKLYPALLLGGLLVICLRERRWRDLAATAAAAAATWVVAQVPAIVGGTAQWKVFWDFNVHRKADLGSLWLVLDQSAHLDLSADTINLWSQVVLAVWCLGVLALGMLAPSVPRLSQLGLLIVTGFLLVNKVYSPQYALWLLPLAVLARPRWRDQIIWQAGELFYFASVWWYLGGYLAPGAGGDAGFYWLATAVRVAAELYLAGVVVRDVWLPHHDPVREREPARWPRLPVQTT